MAGDAKAVVSVLKTLDDVLQKNLKALDAGVAVSGSAGSNQDAEREGTTDVHVQVIFLKVGEVNTIQEKFSADVFIQSRWREPLLDKTGKDGEILDWQKYWNPKLYIENAMADLKDDVWYAVKFYDNEAYICQKRRAKGTFFERMELMDYPFDTQDLTITMTTERGETEVYLVADKIDLPSVNVGSFVDEQEWRLHRHIKSWTKVTTNVYKNTRHKHPAVSLSCKVTRRANFFFYNIILIMIFISSLVFSTFTVSQDLVQNRLQLSFILLLSNITFKFTVSQTLPKVSYLTLMDKYIIGSMFQLCVVCAWHAIVSQLADPDDQTKMDRAILADRIALIVIAAIYIIFNVTFLIISQVKVRRKMRKYERRDLEHTQQIAEIAAAEEEKQTGNKPTSGGPRSPRSVKVVPEKNGDFSDEKNDTMA